MSIWRCEAHGTVNTMDCPRCDDELIALTEEAAENARQAADDPMSGRLNNWSER